MFQASTSVWPLVCSTRRIELRYLVGNLPAASSGVALRKVIMQRFLGFRVLLIPQGPPPSKNAAREPQVDQGVGIGTGFPLFNRATASLTRFLQLRAPPPGGKRPPPVLVVHGRGGAALGDLASYDYFTLGGPYSVRTAVMSSLGCEQCVRSLPSRG